MFEYLKQFINIKDTGKSNSFYPVSEKDIGEQEKRLKIQFPEQLKIFWQEIGYGFLTYPCIIPDQYVFYNVNRIAPPINVADINLLGSESGLILEDVYEYFIDKEDLVFFEIGDSCRFLVMKPNSDNPNAVYTAGTPIKIEDSLEKFIWRLYYESPSFYEDIIEAHYKNI